MRFDTHGGDADHVDQQLLRWTFGQLCGSKRRKSTRAKAPGARKRLRHDAKSLAINYRTDRSTFDKFRLIPDRRGIRE